MKRTIMIILLVLSSLAIAMLAIRFFSGPEDTWICNQGEWITHGKPSAPMPVTGCKITNYEGEITDDEGQITNTETASRGDSFYHITNSPMRILAERNNNEFLPKAYTCEGIGSFPELSVQEIPLDAQSLVLIADDPDSFGSVWYHLLVANIPISAQSMNITSVQFSGAIIGQNSRGELGRGAPCPPRGVHRYTFKVYALNKNLPLSTGFSTEALLKMMEGNILAQAEIIGLYQKGK